MSLSTESESDDKYVLSALISGHQDDVRALTTGRNKNNKNSDSTSTPRLYSASRDSTARSWESSNSSSSVSWKEKEVYRDHEGFINSITCTEDYLLTGGIDCNINVYSLDSSSSSTPSTKPIQTLYGHSANVCALHASGGRVVSGSWDGTARIWEELGGKWKVKHVLISNETRIDSVWDVLALEGKKYQDSVITASADSYIRLWQGDKVDILFKGHTGAVRALSRVTSSAEGDEPSASLFASAGNDGSVRLWNLKGDAITTLEGHDSFIYALITIPFDQDGEGGGLVSSGEDGIVRIWDGQDGDLMQEILVPALSVWSISIFPNGDLALGCSDSLIWVFTKDPTRAADSITSLKYDELMSLRKPTTKKTKSTELLIESLSVLSIAGTKEGAIKLVKIADGTTHAYQWTKDEWIDEGEVIDPTTSSTHDSSTTSDSMEKTLYEGKEYDFVFKIDWKDDVPPLDLAINREDEIEVVVAKFMEKNEKEGLPSSYSDRIIEFVRVSMS